GLPEPLITIWEPASRQLLLEGLPKGYHCPRKVLLNASIKIIRPAQPASLMNVNTPHEMEKAQQLLQARTLAQG
ncbi:MAG TPA: hypothetical protein VEB42_17405, partial [Chitinophagaceae bacterium]|nr:hypothetical protein [Chitinophagaceae bacterium]